MPVIGAMAIWRVFSSLRRRGVVSGDRRAEQRISLGRRLKTLAGDIPESLFFMFQMTFAIIHSVDCGCLSGTYAVFSCLPQPLADLCLCAVCHWVWGGGWFAGWA